MGNQEKKTSYNPDSGLSLKAAIRHYSDPGLWFEYLTFAAPARSLRALLPRARALLKDNHPELRDFKKNQLWKKFRGDLEAQLHSGELIIIGFVAPVPLDGKPERIPKDKVRILTFDYNASSASAPGLEIVGIRVLPNQASVAVEEPEKADRPPPSPPRKNGKNPRGAGRKKGSGPLVKKDEPLIEKMKPLVANGASVWDAALAMVGNAAGKGKDESKAKRLLARFKELEKNNSE